MIVGIDEVGRGAWAGPLVVGAVLLGGEAIEGLTDSKKMSKAQRNNLDLKIRQQATSVGIGWVSAKQIDIIGLSKALKLGATRALSQVRGDYREVIIDGTVAFIDGPDVTTLAKADLLIPSVSAASIVAKEARDRYMRQLDSIYPEFKFGSHVGYGTAAHKEALTKYGATPLHRFSFAPLKAYDTRSITLADHTATVTKQTSSAIGSDAEEVVSVYLRSLGHTIIGRNWKTPRCEIDIISLYGSKLYFTEVKYRKTDSHGGGLDAITSRKLKQMKFAAESYIHTQKAHHFDVCLAVADVAGKPPVVRSFLQLI